MNVRAKTVPFTLCVLLFSQPARASNGAPPERDLKLYTLPNEPKAADFSPDETRVLIEFTRKDNARPGSSPDIAQLWDFRNNKLLAESSLYHRVSNGSQALDDVPRRGRHFVRFSTDGQTAFVYVPGSIYVLDAGDLHALRTFTAPPPPGKPRFSPDGKAFTVLPEVCSLEVSPDNRLIALLWVANEAIADELLDVYDLNSGQRLRRAITPETAIEISSPGSPLSWSHDSRRLIFAAGYGLCLFPEQADVFWFDLDSGLFTPALCTGLPVRAIAIAPGARLLAADSIYPHSHSKLKIFDLTTGKLLKSLVGRGSGVGDLVSISTDGTRVLAFTGKKGTKIDWGDMTSYGVWKDETFSVWNLQNYDGIVTSQSIPGLSKSDVRISSHGHFALSVPPAYPMLGRTVRSFVFELP